MNNKKIFIHIGTYKTGTSSIQWSLADCYDDLLNMGVQYIQAGRHPDFKKHLAFFDYCHKSSYNLVRHNKWKDVNLPNLVCEEILSSSARNFVISEEELSVPDAEIPKKLSFLKDCGDVEVVFCVRRQDKFLESLYLQFIKEPGRRLKQSFAEFLNDPETMKRAKFDEIADNWADVFGVENIRVLDFEILKQQDNLISNVTKIFGVAPDYSFPDMRQNQTISHEMAEIIRRFSAMYPKVRRGRLTLALESMNIVPQKERFIPDELGEIMPRFEDANIRLKKRYGVDLLKYEPVLNKVGPREKLLRNYRFERRINRIFMQLVKDAHKNRNWDFI